MAARACATGLAFTALALAACGGDGEDSSPLSARDQRNGVTFAAERAKVTIGIDADVPRVRGSTVVVVCIFPGKQKNRFETVSADLRWPRNAREMTTDMGRDVEAQASGCLLESGDGGDIAEVEFQREEPE